MIFEMQNSKPPSRIPGTTKKATAAAAATTAKKMLASKGGTNTTNLTFNNEGFDYEDDGAYTNEEYGV